MKIIFLTIEEEIPLGNKEDKELEWIKKVAVINKIVGEMSNKMIKILTDYQEGDCKIVDEEHRHLVCYRATSLTFDRIFNPMVKFSGEMNDKAQEELLKATMPNNK